MNEQQYRLEENNQTNELILWEDAKILNVFKSSYDNRKHLNIIVDKLNEQQTTISALKEENKKLQYESQQTKEYLQTKINECKDYKKMKEIVFGVEQAVGYEKALLQFQKGLKRRLKNE